MTREPTPDEAAQILATADLLRGQVSRQAARESWVFLGWGLFASVMIPPFDVLDGDIWGAIFVICAIGGWLLTMRYARRRSEHVKLGRRGGWSLVWFPWALWNGALVLMAELLHSDVGFIWTVAGVAAGLPLLVIGVHLARHGE